MDQGESSAVINSDDNAADDGDEVDTASAITGNPESKPAVAAAASSSDMINTAAVTSNSKTPLQMPREDGVASNSGDVKDDITLTMATGASDMVETVTPMDEARVDGEPLPEEGKRGPRLKDAKEPAKGDVGDDVGVDTEPTATGLGNATADDGGIPGSTEASAAPDSSVNDEGHSSDDIDGGSGLTGGGRKRALSESDGMEIGAGSSDGSDEEEEAHPAKR